MDLRFIEIPKIDNDILFEELCKDLLTGDETYINVNIHGRSGQKQDGVDVYARKRNDNKWIGIQCKVRSTNSSFSESELLREVKMAKNFNPKISEYYLYTTLERDTKTQELVRKINDELHALEDFIFDIKFWADIAEIIKDEQHLSVYFKYYKKFFRDNTSFGHSIGKLMNLELGFDDKIDTHYELILGKIPELKETEKPTNVHYYKNTYYIINLHNKRMEFFTPTSITEPPYCFISDIIYAIDNRIDCYRVVKWINNISNLDKFIYDDNYNCEFYISRKEYEEYIAEE